MPPTLLWSSQHLCHSGSEKVEKKQDIFRQSELDKLSFIRAICWPFPISLHFYERKWQSHRAVVNLFIFSEGLDTQHICHDFAHQCNLQWNLEQTKEHLFWGSCTQWTSIRMPRYNKRKYNSQFDLSEQVPQDKLRADGMYTV